MQPNLIDANNLYILDLLFQIGALDHNYCSGMNYYRINYLLDAIMTTYCIRFVFDARQTDAIWVKKVSSDYINPKAWWIAFTAHRRISSTSLMTCMSPSAVPGTGLFLFKLWSC